MATNVACLLVLVTAIMVMMQGQSGLAASDSKYCKACSATLQCPDSCPRFNQGSSKSLCNIDCKTCTTECKQSNGTSGGCNEIGAVCQDPRFIGGDGILFYFHGKSNEDFCIVSDTNFHINGHFIGKQVEGRPRDFTWVQAIGILYGSHKVSVGAKKVARWDDDVDQLEVSYDGNTIFLTQLIGESWESPLGDFRVLRTRDVNSVEIQVNNLMKVSINVTYVDEEDNKIHKYDIDSEDCFAHLDLLFTFFNLSSQVDGVLGQTYKQTYKSRVKIGVPMPIMGGYDKFKSSSLFATDCQVGVFDESSFPQTSLEGIDVLTLVPSMSCTSQGENGIVCRR